MEFGRNLTAVQVLLVQVSVLQNLEKQNVMKCFSVHSGICSFAPIRYGTEFRKYVPHECKTMHARMCRKVFHDVSNLQILQIKNMDQHILKSSQISMLSNYTAFPSVGNCVDVNFSETRSIVRLYLETFQDLKQVTRAP